MAGDGVVLGLVGDDALRDPGHQHYRLLTTDLDVAKRYGFEGLPAAETFRDKPGKKKPARTGIVMPLRRPSRGQFGGSCAGARRKLTPA